MKEGNQKTQAQRTGNLGTEKGHPRPTKGGGARVAARCVPNCLWVIVWREADASARATEGALARKAYSRKKGRVDKRRENKNPTSISC